MLLFSRKFIINQCKVRKILDVSEINVFTAKVSTCILILSKKELNNNRRSTNIIEISKYTVGFSQEAVWDVSQKAFESKGPLNNMFRLNG